MVHLQVEEKEEKEEEEQEEERKEERKQKKEEGNQKEGDEYNISKTGNIIKLFSFAAVSFSFKLFLF